MNIQAAKDLIKSRYKNDEGEPFEATDGQAEIFAAIASMAYQRLFITAWTQYGKSDIAGQAILTRASTIPEKIAIVAPTNKKAAIIMGYLIDHIFDNEYTKAKFLINEKESAERIRRERNKEHLTFRCSQGIGEVYTLSAEGRRTKDVLNALLGFGARRVLIDESPLLSEEHYMGILRMIGGHKDSTLIEIGNAIGRNHFYKASRDPTYKKIIIPYTQGIEEGRQTEGYFEEMKRKMPKQLFASLYECKFPSLDDVDVEGYMPLLGESDLDGAYVEEIDLFGDLFLGVDVAGGGRSKSVIAIRGRNGARVAYESESGDTMRLVGATLNLYEMYQVPVHNIFVDALGVGKGVYDRLVEQLGLSVGQINFGNKAEEDDFADVKAQIFWKMAEWIKSGGKLERHQGWEELIEIRYAYQSEKKIKIISKDELGKRGVPSPDYADALALTFAGSQMQKSGMHVVKPAFSGYNRTGGTKVIRPANSGYFRK